MKHIQSFLLVCTHSLRLTSIKQSADYTRFIYIDFGIFCQPVVGSYTLYKLGGCLGSLLKSLFELTVDGEVVCNGKLQIHKLMNDFQFVLVDEEQWCFLNVLHHDLCFARLMVSPN